MPFLFTCPHCGARTQIPESFVGQTGPCHSCGKSVQINPPESAAEVEAPPPSKTSVGVMIALTLGFVSLLLAGVGISLVIVTPNLRNNSNARKLTLAKANIKLIVAAMHSYHSQHGSFPPSYTVDKNGKRMHSWRVLLLPHLGPDAQQLYIQYKMEEPWDSEDNLAVASIMPDVYRSPADRSAVGGNTSSYFVIVGPQTLFPGNGRQAGYENNLDPLNHTILVVESVPRNTIWTEPEDYEIATMRFELNTFSGGDISGPLPGGVMVGLADGSTYFIEEDTPKEMVEAMTTRSGSDEGPPDL